MVTHQESLDFGDEFNVDDESMHPPTAAEEQAMMEALSVMHAISLLRERGFVVVEPVDVEGVDA